MSSQQPQKSQCSCVTWYVNGAVANNTLNKALNKIMNEAIFEELFKDLPERYHPTTWDEAAAFWDTEKKKSPEVAEVVQCRKGCSISAQIHRGNLQVGA